MCQHQAQKKGRPISNRLLSASNAAVPLEEKSAAPRERPKSSNDFSCFQNNLQQVLMCQHQAQKKGRSISNRLLGASNAAVPLSVVFRSRQRLEEKSAAPQERPETSG